MKKFTFIATLMLAFASLTSMAGTRILFTENYENAVAISDTKWGSYMYPAGLSFGNSEDASKYVQVFGSVQNQRSFFCNWGNSIYYDQNGNAIVGDQDSYDLTFEFCVNAMGNNQYNSEIAINAGDTVQENYQTTNKNPLFKLDQIQNPDDETVLEYYINGNTDNTWFPSVGTWYKVYLTVDKSSRQVTYTIQNLTDESYDIAEEVYNLPDSVTDLNATHLWYADARYYNTVYFDNITISKEVEGDWANEPVIALTGVLEDERTYKINFLEGETLHVTGTDGATDQQPYDGCDGVYTYTTTTSGTLQAYTTSGSATSNPSSAYVNCEPIFLPMAVASISAVKAGYAKDYIVTIDKTLVDLQPSITFDYTFTSDDGQTVITQTELASGSKISIPTIGNITFTANAYGYSSRDSWLRNDIAYAVKADVDFQNMTGDQLVTLGFKKMDNLTSTTAGGEGNWTARNRLYCQYNPVLQEDGTTAWSTAYPFGHSTSSGFQGTGIERYQFMQSELTEEKATSLFAPLKTWWNGDSVTTWNPNATVATGYTRAQHQPYGVAGYTSNLKVYPGIGLVCPGTVGDNNDFDPLGVNYGNILNQYPQLYPQGLTENDFVVVYEAADYGSTAIHPQYNVTTEDEALALYKQEVIGTTTTSYKGNVPFFTLYRIDTAIARVQFLTSAGSGINEVGAGNKTNANGTSFGFKKVATSNGVQIVKDGKKFNLAGARLQ